MEAINKIVDFFYSYPSAFIVSLFVIGYLLYYFTFVVKKPQLACSDKKFHKFLTDKVPIVHEKFWPTIWCFESRAMTIIRSFIERAPKVHYDTEILGMPDGGQVRLDWAYNDESTIHPDPLSRPTVVLLPGLTGTSNETYALNLVTEATKLGYRVVVFNNRGNGSELLTARTYCASNSEDLGHVVSHVKKRFPDAPLVGTGVSLGGMILFNYLAKTGKDCNMLAGMCVSMAWNVFESVTSLEKPGLNKHVLNRVLAKGLVDNFQQYMHLFEQHIEDCDHVLKSTTIREFDDRFTAPMFGYSTWQDYYSDACIHDKVHHLEVPVLCLNAADDPFSPKHAIPLNEAEINDNIALLVTSHGGHIGFLEGMFPRKPGYMYRIFSQYIDGVFRHGPKSHLHQD
ncbi:phospholipase ABHD3-like [Mercenaria mercenaria]|uniref:phospholipase ABHD3-like n=1 Tax=Mercenaria mercenaria TaxID=6596 RepID=UPI00234E38B8|nr:phospholipase ABHD3-like [Mercenaria mercenaria]